MREVQRLREKVELSPDGRQAAALGACALLLLGGVFSLGVMIGKKAASMQAPAQPAPDLAVLDAQVRKPEPPARAPAPRPEAAAKPPEVPAAEPPQRARDAAQKSDPVRATAVVASVPPKATVVPAPPRPVQVAPARAVALTPPPRDVGDYAVQVGASQEPAEAARLEGRARGAGLKAYVVEADLGSRGTWYRVRVGAFHDREAADRFRKDVERELRTAAVVMPTH